MKKIVKEAKKHSRTYLMPIFSTAAAVTFWYVYRDGGYWWWLVLIGGILILNVWVYLTNKK